MAEHWRPAAGQVALIEPLEAGGSADCFTGLVLPDSEERVLVDLGASPRPASQECEVVASFFAPDALYRVSATATAVPESTGVLHLDVHDVERVQRRAMPRLRAALPVSLAALDGDTSFTSVTGETVDVAPGGCRVVTERPFPRGADPTISIRVPEGAPVIALARVLEADVQPGRCEYRLVFASISEEDAARLGRLASS